MIFNFTEIHKRKIESFALDKDKPYKSQIENYLHHFAELISDHFPLNPMAYIVTEEYPDVVIVKKVNNEDIKKYNKNELIFVNIPNTD